jgi:hypothetical protein
MDPVVRQRGPDLGLARALGQAEAVRTMGEHVHFVRNAAGGSVKRCSAATGEGSMAVALVHRRLAEAGGD